MNKELKIAVDGTGYVGLLFILLAQHYKNAA